LFQQNRALWFRKEIRGRVVTKTVGTSTLSETGREDFLRGESGELKKEKNKRDARVWGKRGSERGELTPER